MKKLIILMMSIFLFTGCSKGYTELTYAGLEEKLNNGDSFVLVIGSETCSACQDYKPVMKRVVVEEEIDMYYMEIQSLTEEESQLLYSKYVYTATPTTIFIVDGKEESTYNRIVGLPAYDNLVAKLKVLGYKE